MGSSAQNSSGVHWCRRRVKFNEVPKNVPKVPEEVWAALVQSQVTFNRVEALVQSSGEGSRISREGSRKPWCKAKSGSAGFRRRFRRRSGEVSVQSQRSQVRFNRICGHLIHGNPAEVFPALGFAACFRKICKNEILRLLAGVGAGSGSTRFRKKKSVGWKALVQNQVRFNKFPEKEFREINKINNFIIYLKYIYKTYFI